MIAEVVPGMPDWLTIPIMVIGWLGGAALLIVIGKRPRK